MIFLGKEDSLEKGMATLSSVLGWRIPWTKEPGGLYSLWSCKESETAEWLTLSLSHYVLAIQLLDICPEKTIVWEDTCTPVFIAALFTIARTWKKPKHPSIEEWVQKKWYIYTMEYYSAIKRNKTVPFAETWMHLKTVIQRQVIQREKNKYRIILIICGI